jgi:hypothetical protein
VAATGLCNERHSCIVAHPSYGAFHSDLLVGKWILSESRALRIFSDFAAMQQNQRFRTWLYFRVLAFNNNK